MRHLYFYETCMGMQVANQTSVFTALPQVLFIQLALFLAHTPGRAQLSPLPADAHLRRSSPQFLPSSPPTCSQCATNQTMPLHPQAKDLQRVLTVQLRASLCQICAQTQPVPPPVLGYPLPPPRNPRHSQAIDSCTHQQ